MRNVEQLWESVPVGFGIGGKHDRARQAIPLLKVRYSTMIPFYRFIVLLIVFRFFSQKMR